MQQKQTSENRERGIGFKLFNQNSNQKAENILSVERYKRRQIGKLVIANKTAASIHLEQICH